MKILAITVFVWSILFWKGFSYLVWSPYHTKMLKNSVWRRSITKVGDDQPEVHHISSLFRSKRRRRKANKRTKLIQAPNRFSPEDQKILESYDSSWKEKLSSLVDDDVGWRLYTIEKLGYIEKPTTDDDVYKYAIGIKDTQMATDSQLHTSSVEELLPSTNFSEKRSKTATSFLDKTEGTNNDLVQFNLKSYPQYILWNNTSITSILSHFLEKDFLYPDTIVNEDLPRPVFLQLKELLKVLKTWQLSNTSDLSRDRVFTSPLPPISSLRSLQFSSSSQMRNSFLALIATLFSEYYPQESSTRSLRWNDASSFSFPLIQRVPDPFLPFKRNILRTSLLLYEDVIPRYLEFLDKFDSEEGGGFKTAEQLERFLLSLHQLILFFTKSDTDISAFQQSMKASVKEILQETIHQSVHIPHQEKRLAAFFKYLEDHLPQQKLPLPTLTIINTIQRRYFQRREKKGQSNQEEDIFVINWIPSSFSSSLFIEFLYFHALVVVGVIDRVDIHLSAPYASSPSSSPSIPYFPYFDCIPNEEDLGLIFDYISDPVHSDIWAVRHFGQSMKQLYLRGRIRVVPLQRDWTEGDQKEKVVLIQNEEEWFSHHQHQAKTQSMSENRSIHSLFYF